MRDYKLHLEDILQSIKKIEKYTRGADLHKFQDDELVVDAVVRNLAIIGEAAKHIPPQIKKKLPDIEWKKLSGLRNILIHEYFGVDSQILWDIVANKIPALKEKIQNYLKEH